MKELMPREKMIKYGVENLDDYELLALLLGVGTRGEGVIDFSKRIMNELNGLDDIVNMKMEDWMKIKGIKKGKASKLVAFLEFSKRIYNYEKKETSLRTANDIFEFIKYDLSGKTHEHMIVLYVNTKCKLIKKKVSTQGKVNILYVDIKEIVNDALKCNATGVFLIHNHPSGDTTPSEADIDLTDAINKALKYFDISLLDHIIFGNNNYFSFKSNNLL
ncbi:MAG: DNA repair protein RadC [bacterium]